MYKLLFVEDEEIIRKVLPAIIDWKSIGIEISAAVRNGVEALEYLEENQVDLLLTDIRMPVMNGLELACEVKSRYPAIKTILLSAYSEFEYARKGIEYGVYGYLLKSSDEDEIISYFRVLKETLDKESLLGDFTNTRLDRDNLWTKRDNFFRSLIEGKVYTTAEAAIEDGQKLKMQLDAASYRVILVQVDEAAALADEIGAGGLKQARKLLAEQLLEYIEWQNKGFIIDKNGEVAVIWTSGQDNFDIYLKEAFIHINDELELLEDGNRLSATWAVGNEVKTLLELPCSYRSAEEAMALKACLGKGRIIEAAKDIGAVSSLSAQQIENITRELEQQLQIQGLHRINSYLEELEQYITSNRICSRPQVEMLANQLVLCLSSYATRLNLGGEQLVEKTGVLLKAIGKFEAFSTIFEQIKIFSLDIIEGANGKGSCPTKRIVEKAVNFMYDSYSRDISLEEAASHVSVHPVHLSRLFRQELDQTFKSVLTAIRMDKARELLAASDLKVYEVSQAVGYKKPRYFSELFKEVTGLTPLEYREKS